MKDGRWVTIAESQLAHEKQGLEAVKQTLGRSGRAGRPATVARSWPTRGTARRRGVVALPADVRRRLHLDESGCAGRDH